MSDCLSDNCRGNNTLKSPAKLNLGLHVVGRRENGFHELESLFWPITLYDQILVKKNETQSNWVTCRWADSSENGSSLPQQSENIAYKTLELLNMNGFAIEIQKRIPVGAGLGGGSSNAGTLLSHFRPQYDSVEASKLGADVPFFLNPVPSFVSGIGEHRMPLVNPTPLFFYLVIPPKPLWTAEVFKVFRELQMPFAPKLDASSLTGLQNSLEPAAIQLYPELKSILDMLRSTSPDYCSITGSGSVCFAAFRDAAKCEEISQVFSESFRSRGCKSVLAATHISA